MDFDLAEEHHLLRASIRRALSTAGDAASGDAWHHCAALGLTALDCRDGAAPADELVCMTVAQEEMGRALVTAPFNETVVQAGGLVRAAGSVAMRERLLPPIESGAAIIAVAHAEPRARYAREVPGVAAQREGEHWRITGDLPLVSFGDRAEWVIVPVRTGPAGDTTLFLVPPGAPGVERSAVARHDGVPAADIRLRDVRLTDAAQLGPTGGAAPLLAGARRMAIVALAAEAVGCMEALLALTVEYLKTREQFGRALGSFQVLQHRAADMYAAVEQARSMMLYAMLSARDADVPSRERAIAAAKVQIGRSARFVAQQAIQLHGGMGLAIEYRAGHYVRRLTAIELAFGDADDHLAWLGDHGGLFAPAVA